MITVNNKNLCENCFMETDQEPCPYCSYEKGHETDDTVALAMGSLLDDRYMIGGVLGKGGFGITYLAYDIKLEKRIAVKEYYPRGIASRGNDRITVSAADVDSNKTFNDGAERFYREAELVSQFNGNPNIVNVYDFFRENDTVYFTMGYLQGETLKTYINEKGVITEGQAMNVYKCVTNALLITHSMNILHRDISPDNIMLCSDGTIKLLDFGAARQVIAEESHSLSVILKQGFAPLEQYQKKGKQGPWTDIYALGATVFTALTGDFLDDPMSRMEDDSEFEANRHGISEGLWSIIRKSTMLRIGDRYQDIVDLKKDLTALKITEEPFRGIGKAASEDKSKLPNYALYADSKKREEVDVNETVILKEDPMPSGNETVFIGDEKPTGADVTVYDPVGTNRKYVSENESKAEYFGDNINESEKSHYDGQKQSKKSMIIPIVAGAVALVIVSVIATAMLKDNKNNVEEMTVASQQTESVDVVEADNDIPDSVKASYDDLILYQEPSTLSDMVIKVEKGSILKVESKEGDWYGVRLQFKKNIYGWVKSGDVEPNE